MSILNVSNGTSAFVVTFIIGFAVANIFSLVFFIAVKEYPERSSEISGLMMMAISGGAIVPFIMGLVSDFSSELYGMMILAICTFAILLFSLKIPITDVVTNKYEVQFP